MFIDDRIDDIFCLYDNIGRKDVRKNIYIQLPDWYMDYNREQIQHLRGHPSEIEELQ